LPNRKGKTLTITVRRKSGKKNWEGGGGGGIKAGQAILGSTDRSCHTKCKILTALTRSRFIQGFFVQKVEMIYFVRQRYLVPELYFVTHSALKNVFKY
jgi:hypothetical protein